MMKKAQAETMGLMVIVILIVIIGLIFIRFNLREKNENYKDVRTSLEANNILKAVLRLKTSEINVLELIDRCYFSRENCENTKDKLQEILGFVLKKEENYNFLLRGEGEELFRIDNKCIIGVNAQHQFSKDNIFYEAEMRICRK